MEPIFLLGGHDLEMETIRKLLECIGFSDLDSSHAGNGHYADRNLRWDNSFLSKYSDILETYGNRNGFHIYGIELRPDPPAGKSNGQRIALPANYTLIDHHDDDSDKESSLEQIFKILRAHYAKDIEWRREFELVAANDSKYIPGMKAIPDEKGGPASDKEVADIRFRDRRAQGITPDMEEAAKKAMHESLETDNNLIVVNISGNAVAMPWVNKVNAIIQNWYLGTEAGSALAAILMGDVNPSGKLPFTFPTKLENVPAHSVGEYSGVRSNEVVNVKYNEGIFVGYRWADKQKNTRPLFSFGHGLSYTTFKYGKPNIDQKKMQQNDILTVTVPITNTGKREGSEIVQLYISDLESSLPRPIKELKGFKKIKLVPGETKFVEFKIDKKALSFFDDTRHEWVAESGKFEVIIAASSTDIRGKVTFELTE